MLVVPPRASLRLHPLSTKRLVLQPVDRQDARELFRAVDESRADLERWLPWVPFNPDEEASYRFAELCEGDWDNTRACRLTIRERQTRKLVGIVGLEALLHLHQSGELGYWLRSSAAGHGVMTEACQEILRWAFGPVSMHRVRVAAATDNHRSLSVIARLGFRFEGIARQAERCQGRWLDHAVFGMLASDSALL